MKRPELDVSRLEGLAALAIAIERLVALKQALPACGDPLVLSALAQALPARVGELVPEVCLALSEVALELAPYGPRLPGDILELSPGCARRGCAPRSRRATTRVGPRSTSCSSCMS